MNKKSILTIIVLMAFALLGSIGLQIYWIRNAVNLNKEQFDKNAFAALRHVADRLEKEENNKISKISDFVLRKNTGDRVISDEEFLDLGLDPEQVEAFDSTYRSTHAYMENGQSLQEYRRSHNMIETMLAQQIFGVKPVEERINAESLDKTIHQELKNVGLGNVEFQHGIFSNQSNGFVIKNGHYVIIDSNNPTPDAVQAQAFDYLNTTRYKVDLFSVQDNKSPGFLSLYFSNKTGYLWSSVWKTLLASIFFTGTTLFCFAYTIYVIFRQKKLDQIKNDFINNMTHEFKTPIATISLAADSITAPSILTNPDKVKRFVDIIKQENKRMNGQVEKVLQMAILDRDTLQLKITEIDINEIIEHALANFSLQVEARGGFIHTELLAVRHVIEGDFTHISNIIHNLLDNANKYSPENPEIIIRTRNISDGIEISVEDKGLGLSPASRKLIFDKFYRVPTENIHDIKGFGLGLSYVRNMLTAHKGSIEVISEYGKGSSFIVFLPFKQSGNDNNS